MVFSESSNSAHSKSVFNSGVHFSTSFVQAGFSEFHCLTQFFPLQFPGIFVSLDRFVCPPGLPGSCLLVSCGWIGVVLAVAVESHSVGWSSRFMSPFHQIGLSVVLASAWSLTWYQSQKSQVRVLAFTQFILKIVVTPFVHVLASWAAPLSLHLLTCLPRYVRGGGVYKWIAYPFP